MKDRHEVDARFWFSLVAVLIAIIGVGLSAIIAF
jgi:hypothetical protein